MIFPLNYAEYVPVFSLLHDRAYRHEEAWEQSIILKIKEHL
jgi:hypothetical protein